MPPPETRRRDDVVAPRVHRVMRGADTPGFGPDAAYRLAFLALAAPAPLLAEVGERVLWICSLSQDATRLACIADADADAADLEQAKRPVAAVVRGTAFALDARRMCIADLWSPATEMDFVEQLANATICYRSAGCRVLLAPERVASVPPVLARR